MRGCKVVRIDGGTVHVEVTVMLLDDEFTTDESVALGEGLVAST